jgi:ribokinase
LPIEIIVLGSLNIDLVVKTERAPRAGETLAAQDFQTNPGGKGANQAVAIAKSGGSVAMIGRVGADDYGHSLKDSLATYGVDISTILTTPGIATGVALIIVEESGENRILLVPGANGKVTTEDIDAAESLISQAKALVLQMEIPWEATKHALELADAHHVPTVLNLAPAYPISVEWLKKISCLIVNESEMHLLSGIEVVDNQSAQQAASRLLDQGVAAVILTLGSKGVLLATETGTEYVPAHPVDVVDTTAAGDAFVGSFVTALIRTGDLSESIKLANAAGALAVTKFGAQNSIPSYEEVKEYLATQPI